LSQVPNDLRRQHREGDERFIASILNTSKKTEEESQSPMYDDAGATTRRRICKYDTRKIWDLPHHFRGPTIWSLLSLQYGKPQIKYMFKKPNKDIVMRTAENFSLFSTFKKIMIHA
jgi:hypothetical protein